jgi:hypothetical protein
MASLRRQLAINYVDGPPVLSTLFSCAALLQPACNAAEAAAVNSEELQYVGGAYQSVDANFWLVTPQSIVLRTPLQE